MFSSTPSLGHDPLLLGLKLECGLFCTNELVEFGVAYFTDLITPGRTLGAGEQTGRCPPCTCPVSHGQVPPGHATLWCWPVEFLLNHRPDFP